MRASIALKRWLLLFVVAIVLTYASLCGLLYALQRDVLYHPSPLLFEPDTPAISIRGATGVLHGWVVNPGQQKAVIYFGGNGESVERDVDFFRAILPNESIYLVPYRGYGPNTGEPSEAGIEADALTIFDFVHSRHGQIALFGRSLGSGVATYVAARRPIAKLVLATPYDSILNIARDRYGIFPVSMLLRDRYESWRYADAIETPVLVLLGANDEIIPRAHSDALIAHFRVKPLVVVIPRAGHNNLSNSPLYAKAIADFMRVAASVEATAAPTTTPSPRH